MVLMAYSNAEYYSHFIQKYNIHVSTQAVSYTHLDVYKRQVVVHVYFGSVIR